MCERKRKSQQGKSLCGDFNSLWQRDSTKGIVYREDVLRKKIIKGATQGAGAINLVNG